jgi:hypothetical protein
MSSNASSYLKATAYREQPSALKLVPLSNPVFMSNYKQHVLKATKDATPPQTADKFAKNMALFELRQPRNAIGPFAESDSGYADA